MNNVNVKLAKIYSTANSESRNDLSPPHSTPTDIKHPLPIFSQAKPAEDHHRVHRTTETQAPNQNKRLARARLILGAFLPSTSRENQRSPLGNTADSR